MLVPSYITQNTAGDIYRRAREENTRGRGQRGLTYWGGALTPARTLAGIARDHEHRPASMGGVVRMATGAPARIRMTSHSGAWQHRKKTRRQSAPHSAHSATLNEQNCELRNVLIERAQGGRAGGKQGRRCATAGRETAKKQGPGKESGGRRQQWLGSRRTDAKTRENNGAGNGEARRKGAVFSKRKRLVESATNREGFGKLLHCYGHVYRKRLKVLDRRKARGHKRPVFFVEYRRREEGSV